MTNSEGDESAAGGHAFARLTPYELVFMEGDFESRIFPRIREEAAAEGVDPRRRDRFAFLSTAGDVVREVTPTDAPPESLGQYRELLFHAFHHWSGGKRLFVLDPAVARYLVEANPRLEGWSFRSPGRSIYLQLPANLFWSSISPDTPPEPVDGFFVTVAEGTDAFEATFEHVQALVVLGVRRSRAGFSVIPVESEFGQGIAKPWIAEERAGGDFHNELPGGEIAGLYSVLTTGEVLKFLARAFWYIDSFPDALVEVPAFEPRPDSEDPPPSHLAHTRVTLASRIPNQSDDA